MATYSTGSEQPVGHAFKRGYRRQFHYLTPKQRKRVAAMRSVLRERQGHVLLTGPAGTGKSSLLQRIVEDCRANDVLVIRFRTPPLSFDDLTTALLRRIQPGTEVSEHPGLREQALVGALPGYRLHRRVVIAVDEAQSAADEVLSGLFQFAAIAQAHRGAGVALLLAGTEGLGDRLTGLMRRPLAQLVRMTVPLAPLQPDEVGEYIRHQLTAADVQDTQVFPAEVIAQIAELSGGVQSQISSLCGLAIVGAHLEQSRQVTPEIVYQVWRDHWIAPIALKPERDVPIGRALADVPPPRDEVVIAVDRDHEPANLAVFDIDDEERPLPRGITARRDHWIRPDHRASDRRPAHRRPWGWVLLTGVLLAGAASVPLRDHSQVALPIEWDRLAGIAERVIAGWSLDGLGDWHPSEDRSPAAETPTGDRDPASRRGTVWRSPAELVQAGSEGRTESAQPEADDPGPVVQLPASPADLRLQAPPQVGSADALDERRGDDAIAGQASMERDPDRGRVGSGQTSGPVPAEPGAGAMMRISALLQRAERHLVADRLLSPRFDNAFYGYSEVLRIDPSNEDAGLGIERIKARLIVHSRTAQTNRDLVGARRALEKVLIVDASDQRALALLDRLDRVGPPTGAASKSIP